MTQGTDTALRKASGLMRERPVEAAATLAPVLERFPRNQRALSILSDLHRRAEECVPQTTLGLLDGLVAAGRAGEALDFLRTCPSAAFGSFGLQMVAGKACSVLKRHRDAAGHFEAAGLLRPGAAAPWLMAGNEAFLAGDLTGAERLFGKALSLSHDDVDILNNLGMTLAALKRFDEADARFAAAARLDPLSARVAYNRANAFRDARQNDRAMEFYRLALELDPENAGAANNLGTLLYQMGRRAEAETAYLRAVEVRPGFAQAHRNLSAVHRYTPDDPLLGVLDRNLATSANDRDTMYLRFARSKAYEDCGDHAQAFSSLVEANAARKRLNRYDISVDELLFSTLHRLFERPLEPLPRGNGTLRPVFILGMMRSGTSLVEQIVSSHSSVFGAGELESLGKLCLPAVETFLSTGRHPAASDMAALRDAYLTEIRSLSGGGYAVVTDKMPANFRWIGFILAAFPEARIIHMRRDPVATCWSIFKNYFSSDGNGFAFDLGDIAAYWKLYSGLIDHWHGLFPGQIMDVPYEALTHEPEPWARRIVDHAGLPWEDGCLDFHRNDRAVRTASALQVRQQIYTGSSEAWRMYETQLQPLVTALGPLASR